MSEEIGEEDIHNNIEFKTLLSPIFSGESTVYNLEFNHESFRSTLHVRVFCNRGVVTLDNKRMNSLDELAEALIEKMKMHYAKEKQNER